jgi:2-dehydro-3-deoxyphosphooctonate aldolase (KDO 8-P synthase)
VGGAAPLLFIAGPCVIESEEHTVKLAMALAEIAREEGLPMIFKASFDKANRTSVGSYRGPGMEAGLDILSKARAASGLPICTDIHEVWQADPVGSVADLLQIPAMLARQTDLLVAAGETGKPVNVKKMQMAAPGDMIWAAKKIESTGNNQILLCERGSAFGYHNLVVDMRGLVEMAELGYPVVFDATHSVQKPSGAGGKSGGDSRLAPVLARAAVATGALSALFFEVHNNPSAALSDGPNMLDLEAFRRTARQCKALSELVRRDSV